MTTRFEVRERDGRYGIYDLTTETWASRTYRHRSSADTYLAAVVLGRREVIIAWILGTNAPDEIRTGSHGGHEWRRQHGDQSQLIA